MGLKLVSDDKGPVTIFRKEGNNGFVRYSAGISSKDKNGDWVNGYLDLNFKKGVELGNKAKINIKNSFPCVREYNGTKYYSYFVMDFEVVEEGEAINKPDENGFCNIPDGADDLPFAAPTR